MQYTDEGYELTKESESCRLVAYPDPGPTGLPWTIGWGHTRGVYEGMTCTQEQADEWLVQDMEWAVKTVNDLVTVPLSQNQFNALVDFAFNIGRTKFSKSDLLVKLNNGEYDEVDGELLQWVHSGGKVLRGLQIRRRKAADLFEDEPPSLG